MSYNTESGHELSGHGAKIANAVLNAGPPLESWLLSDRRSRIPDLALCVDVGQPPEPPAHPIRSRRVSLKRFLDYDHVMVSPSNGSFEGPTDNVLREPGASRRVALSVPSFFTLTEVLQEDDLIAFMPRRLFARRSKNLRTITAPFAVPGFDVISAWHPRTDSESAHMWMREQLLKLGESAA